MTQGEPAYRDAEVDARLAASMLGCTESDIAESATEIVSTGLWWMIIPVRSLSAMSALEPDQRLIESVCRERGAIGVTTFCPEARANEATYRLRSFAPGQGVPEDPPCGSGNGSTAAYLAKHRYAEHTSSNTSPSKASRLDERVVSTCSASATEMASPCASANTRSKSWKATSGLEDLRLPKGLPSVTLRKVNASRHFSTTNV